MVPGGHAVSVSCSAGRRRRAGFTFDGVRPPWSGLLPRSVPGSRRRSTRTVAGTPRARDNLSARATIPPTERTGRSESTPIPERLT
jgi:hypothetical protein